MQPHSVGFSPKGPTQLGQKGKGHVGHGDPGRETALPPPLRVDLEGGTERKP